MDADFLTQLREATKEQTKDWLVMKHGLTRLSQGTQRAVWAAAIPHWFDAEFLDFLLGESTQTSSNDFEVLTHLSFVETFPDLGFNVHEHSRRVLLETLWQSDPSNFIELSRRAQDYCAQQNQNEPAWRIELIYHSLTANVTEGLKLFTQQVKKWKRERLDEKVESLVKTALEVAEAGRIPSKAKETIEIAYAGLGLVYGRKDTKRTTDQKIVEEFLAGDGTAVRTVDGWITRAAWPYQRRLASKWEDVLQDARLEVTRHLQEGHFRGESSLRTFLWRIVSYACLDTLRQQSKWRWMDLENQDDPDSVVRRYIDQETEELPSRKEDRDLLLRVLERVPQDCRELWKLIVAGLTYREMSTKLGIAEGTIRVRILRCRERAGTLRRELLDSQTAKSEPKRHYARGKQNS